MAKGIKVGSSLRLTSPIPVLLNSVYPDQAARWAEGQVRHTAWDYHQEDTGTYWRIKPLAQCFTADGQGALTVPATQAGTWGTLAAHWVPQNSTPASAQLTTAQVAAVNAANSPAGTNPFVTELDLKPLTRSVNGTVPDASGNITLAVGSGGGGSFAGFEVERFTTLPHVSAKATSLANVWGLEVNGVVQRKPSADNTYAPDYTLTIDGAGLVTVTAVGTVPSPLEAQLIYVPGATAAGRATVTNTGNALFTGTGSQLVFLIAHGLGAVPANFTVVANNAASEGFTTPTADATNIAVPYSIAPANGAALSLHWSASL